jgi:hypothetical protein
MPRGCRVSELVAVTERRLIHGEHVLAATASATLGARNGRLLINTNDIAIVRKAFLYR